MPGVVRRGGGLSRPRYALKRRREVSRPLGLLLPGINVITRPLGLLLPEINVINVAKRPPPSFFLR